MARTLEEIRDRIEELIQERDKPESLRLMTLDEIEEEAAQLGREVEQACIASRIDAVQQTAFSPSALARLSRLQQHCQPQLGRHQDKKPRR